MSVTSHIIPAFAASGERDNQDKKSQFAAVGASTRGAWTLLQSRPEKSASNCPVDRRMIPSRIGGQAKAPCSNLL